MKTRFLEIWDKEAGGMTPEELNELAECEGFISFPPIVSLIYWIREFNSSFNRFRGKLSDASLGISDRALGAQLWRRVLDNEFKIHTDV